MTKVDKGASFVQFVYPFLFESTEFETRRKALIAAQWPARAGQSLKVWNSDRYSEEDLLPHVARYLNPADGSPPTACLWRLDGAAMQSSNGLGANYCWELLFGKSAVEFKMEAVSLSLFCVGVGFVAIRAMPVSDDQDAWLDFIHYFRYSDGQRNAKVSIRRRVAEGKTEPFFPPPAGGLEAHPEGCGLFDTILTGLLTTGKLSTDTESWWREVFVPGRMLPFACVYFDGVSDNDQAPLLYRTRKFFHARQEIHPGKTNLDDPAKLEYAEGQWFTFSLDGGAFVAIDAPQTPFFRKTQPSHLGDQYFLLFLIALHQRFALIHLSEQVAAKWPETGDDVSDEKRELVFGRIRDALLMFAARGNYTQVMQRENHHLCYRKWRDTFEIDALHREVSDEVREMHDYLLMRKTERIRVLTEEQARADRDREEAAKKRAHVLQLLGLCFALPALVIGFLGINLKGWTSGDGMVFWYAIVWGMGGLAVALIVSWRLTK